MFDCTVWLGGGANAWTCDDEKDEIKMDKYGGPSLGSENERNVDKSGYGRESKHRVDSISTLPALVDTNIKDTKYTKDYNDNMDNISNLENISSLGNTAKGIYVFCLFFS